jgi:hypothetical protein
MPEDVPRPGPAAIRTDFGAIFVSLELSRKTWRITSLTPGAGDRHSVVAADVPGLLQRLAELKRRAAARTQQLPDIAVRTLALTSPQMRRSHRTRAGAADLAMRKLVRCSSGHHAGTKRWCLRRRASWQGTSSTRTSSQTRCQRFRYPTDAGVLGAEG